MPCHEHADHPHAHGPECGHREVRHEGHTDYLHDGHLHSPHDAHADEHRLGIDRKRPAVCAPIECGVAHTEPGVPHGDHVDFEVRGCLHHPHGDHCDLHGPL